MKKFQRKYFVMRLQGGLGNQLFQYARIRYLNHRYNKEACLDINDFCKNSKRTYELGHFFTTLPTINSKIFQKLTKSRRSLWLSFFSKKTCYELCNEVTPFSSESLNIPSSPTYFQGFFQSEKYFAPIRNLLLNELRLSTPLPSKVAKMKNRIASCISCAIHIRRTDYFSHSTLAPLPLNYYYMAIEFMERKLHERGIGPVHYFIFSDDMQWVRDNFYNLSSITYVDLNDETKAYFDLELLKSCRHQIIANSSFSWWGAWLNNYADKIVIAPLKWFSMRSNMDDPRDSDIIPSNWITLAPC